MQAIIVSGSLGMGLNDQSGQGNVTLAESREASPIPVALQVVHPPEQATGQLDKAKYTGTGCRKQLLLDHMLVNSYLPPHSPAPPIEEVTVLGPEGAQEIVDRWRPFNRGESSADHLHDLYLTMLWMPVTLLARGRAKSIISRSLLVLLKKVFSK